MYPCPWLTAPQAAAALGVSISTLYRWRTQQLLVPGEDWYRKFPSARSPLLYNVASVQRRIASLSARSAQELESVLG
ncbi:MULTISPECIES: helix-turn-helix domain-containing protein [unclassified Cyanobium]|uniref:helix-turn-helix domain-containing protein n=1 Tax=unclassified Cyanobium TaxID=2627006 RepID=UPI0020CCDC85|nr:MULTISPECIES: helix-turn-helix domain-containing protein [unclassified Cyanobium]MCP9861446.1 helix-turn-helix domain-containing protein [Cyanobium sp. Cruz-8H5]MCP9868650.1 helix-turn-helix domain-containing protein [Cyanobium sp. Cruz-8D1]